MASINPEPAPENLAARSFWDELVAKVERGELRIQLIVGGHETETRSLDGVGQLALLTGKVHFSMIFDADEALGARRAQVMRALASRTN
jgi:hypothetical protein